MGVRASKLRKLIGAAAGGPPLPPRGYVPICVGFHGDTRQFIVHTKMFGNAEFSELLYKSAEEYGFCSEGILRIAHEAKDFEQWMMIRTTKRKIIRVKPV